MAATEDDFVHLHGDTVIPEDYVSVWRTIRPSDASILTRKTKSQQPCRSGRTRPR